MKYTFLVGAAEDLDVARPQFAAAYKLMTEVYYWQAFDPLFDVGEMDSNEQLALNLCSLIEECSSICLLPDWVESKEARLLAYTAVSLGYPTFYAQLDKGTIEPIKHRVVKNLLNSERLEIEETE